MIAARTVSKEHIEFTEIATPNVGHGEGLVAIDHVGLCGTDLHIWEDDYVTDLPLVQGHELTGIVVELGEDSADLKIGDRVAIDPLISCGSCRACQISRANACPNLRVLGCYMDGGLTQQLAWPVSKLHRVPEGVPAALAALAEPTSIAMQAVQRGRTTAADTVLVLGCGPIGLLATLCASELGARVIAVDTVAERAEFAREFGAAATTTIDPDTVFPSAELTQILTDFHAAEGPTLVIEATGVPTSLANAVHIVSAGGRIVQVGISGRPAAFPMNLIAFKEIDLLGSRNSRELIPDCLQLISQQMETFHKLISYTFPFHQLTEAFKTMRNNKQLVGKVIIEINPAEEQA